MTSREPTVYHCSAEAVEGFAVQVRWNDGTIETFATFSDAYEQAKRNPEIWKLSFPLPTGERVRLVRTTLDREGVAECFVVEQLMDEVAAELAKESQP